MQVSDLSTELGVPASVVLDACQRLGIEASWAGADLSEIDGARLRADPSLTTSTGLPPTAVGSIPGFVELGPGNSPPSVPSSGPVSTRAHQRTFDRRAGTAVTLVVVGLAALVVGNQFANAFVIVGFWLVAVFCLLACLVVGRRSWRRARVHGDRYRGSWLAPLAMVVAIAGLAGLGTAVYTVMGDAPAEEASMGIGEFSSVQRVRWGYQRVVLLKQNGWKQPIKASGSCWMLSERERDQDNRPAERIEVGNVSVSCNTGHTIEVLDTYNISRDADSLYPGAEALVGNGQNECADELSRVREVLATEDLDEVTMLIEIPTEQGWDDADHSVACVAVTPERTSALLSEG